MCTLPIHSQYKNNNTFIAWNKQSSTSGSDWDVKYVFSLSANVFTELDLESVDQQADSSMWLSTPQTMKYPLPSSAKVCQTASIQVLADRMIRLTMTDEAGKQSSARYDGINPLLHQKTIIMSS